MLNSNETPQAYEIALDARVSANVCTEGYPEYEEIANQALIQAVAEQDTGEEG